MKLVTGTQMKSLDQQVVQGAGIPALTLMENAGRQVAEALARRFPDLDRRRVVVVCGKGNNGGDGLVAARALFERAVQVEVFLLAKPQDCSPETSAQLQALGRTAVPLACVCAEADLSALSSSLERADIVIDALLGVGLRGGASGLYAAAIRQINRSKAFCLAVDVPSGVDADGGRVEGEAVEADATVTLGLPKTGLLFHPGRRFVGALELASIGYPQALVDAFESGLVWLDREFVKQQLPPRPAYSHKGCFGRALLLAGSGGMSGAAVLALRAALRSGVGLLHAAYPASLDGVIGTSVWEAIKHPLREQEGCLDDTSLETLLRLSQEMDALALGPGLSRHPRTQRLIAALVPRLDLPLIIDADGLNALAGGLDLLQQRRAPTVLTPHSGELSRLSGLSVSQIESDRLAEARKFAQAHRVVVVLKGVPTVVVTPQGEAYVNSTGNSGLAKGGSGDVLTGMILALCAQGVAPEAAACCAVWLHGRAADLLQASVGERAMLPSDVIEALPRVFLELERS